MIKRLQKIQPLHIVILMMVAFFLYFSLFTIIRYRNLWAHYFDLGIMHQTVYNTYRALQTSDWGRVLELTNPHGFEQIKRMAIHNDIILAPLALFYFISPKPDVLLLLQVLSVTLGALAVYLITKIVFEKNKNNGWYGVLFAFAYLMYPALQKATIFDFHPVTMATGFMLWMFYFWLQKEYWLSLVFFGLSLLTKEQVPLSTGFFSAFILYQLIRTKWKNVSLFGRLYPFVIGSISVVWFALVLTVIMPYFRGGDHFALGYYGDLGDSPFKVIVGIFTNPAYLFKYIIHIDTFTYIRDLLGPIGFLSLFSPLHLAIALPEFGINLLSNNWNLRSIGYHYTSVITPFVFISAIYGLRNMQQWIVERKYNRFMWLSAAYVVVCVMGFAATIGPLPFSGRSDTIAYGPVRKQVPAVLEWSSVLADETLKVSTTGKIAPYFTSRRYYYIFSENYTLADYVIIMTSEIDHDFQSSILRPAYDKLQKDPYFMQIYNKDGIEVYKKLPDQIYSMK